MAVDVPDEVKMENTPCPAGCNEGDEFVLTGRDRLHNLPGEFTVVRCRRCGLMRTDPRPTPETIGYYYPDSYGPYLQTKISAEVNRSKAIFLAKRIAKGVFQFNTTRLPSLKPGRALEVGCASGVFMRELAQRGWAVSGIEFSATAAKNARSLGYQVHTGPIETAPPPDAPLDLVVAWMVLEHLHDPIFALRKLHQWVKPGGWLVLSVPNANSLEFRVFKDAWYALQLPTHLYHFTPQTLMQVLTESGWIMGGVYHQRGLGNLVASMGYVLHDRNLFPGIANMLVKFPEKSGFRPYFSFPLAYVASLFGQTGRMTVWARKPR